MVSEYKLFSWACDVADYLVTRHNAQEAERTTREEIAHIHDKQNKLIEENKEVKNQAQIETQVYTSLIQPHIKRESIFQV